MSGILRQENQIKVKRIVVSDNLAEMIFLVKILRNFIPQLQLVTPTKNESNNE